MSHLKIMIAVLLSGIALATVAQAAGPKEVTPIGFWKTIDESTGKPKSIVQIWKTSDQVLMGKVIKLFPKAIADKTKVCSSCAGNLRNQPVVGMVIISGLKASENQWSSGKILDTENGKTYSCSLKIGENGKRLKVHGYVGIPLLGRSQTWERVDLMSDG